MDYIQFGHGDKAFVILPGLSVESVMNYRDAVADAYQLLADNYTVYMFDRRKELPDTYSVREMAQDTAEALRTLGLDQVFLFGASQGGMMAMEIAVMEPDLVEKLVLGSTASFVGEEQYRVVEKWIRLAEAGDAEALYLSFGEAVYPAAVFEQSKQLLSEAAKAVTVEDMSRFVILAKGLKDFDVTSEMAKITCPVLVIGSRDDHVLGAEASEKIAEQILVSKEAGSQDVELFMYEDYGHAAYDTAPDYKERILEFLQKE